MITYINLPGSYLVSPLSNCLFWISEVTMNRVRNVRRPPKENGRQFLQWTLDQVVLQSSVAKFISIVLTVVSPLQVFDKPQGRHQFFNVSRRWPKPATYPKVSFDIVRQGWFMCWVASDKLFDLCPLRYDMRNAPLHLFVSVSCLFWVSPIPALEVQQVQRSGMYSQSYPE